MGKETKELLEAKINLEEAKEYHNQYKVAVSKQIENQDKHISNKCKDIIICIDEFLEKNNDIDTHRIARKIKAGLTDIINWPEHRKFMCSYSALMPFEQD